MATAPNTTPDYRNRVRESRMPFGIPGGLPDRCGFALDQCVCHQCYHRKQSIQTGSGPGNRQIIPLSLSFDAQMRLRFFKGHLQAPATDEPGQNLQWRVRQFGRQQCLRLKLSLLVTDQRPSYDDARVVRPTPPQSCLSADFNSPFAIAIPVLDLQRRWIKSSLVYGVLSLSKSTSGIPTIGSTGSLQHLSGYCENCSRIL